MTVVAGVDESPLAVDIVQRAAEEARWRGEELHVVHVFHPPVAYLEFPVDLQSIAAAERSSVWGAIEPLLTEVQEYVQAGAACISCIKSEDEEFTPLGRALTDRVGSLEEKLRTRP